MNTHFLVTVVFVAGVSTGWLSKTWLGPAPLVSNNIATTYNQDTIPDSINETQSTSLTLKSTTTNASTTSGVNVDFSSASPRQIQNPPSRQSALTHFSNLLNDRFYYEAMDLYQEADQQYGKTPAQLKSALLDHLSTLSKSRNNTDFSELIDSYLSVYYDDIDVLLLLAAFNQSNGSYLETIDVYLLAKTYAYTEVDEQNLLTHFNGFVRQIDLTYTNQRNWLSLLNLYSHIDASGLMTSTHRYGQALAHLGNGDRLSATEQLIQLENDNFVGEQATIALNKLASQSGEIAIRSTPVFEDSSAIKLQQRGNQYVVGLTVGQQDNVNLLIDTGASMTTLSQASFYALNSNGEAVIQDRRVFRTANGIVQGTVYSMPEITLGPYLLKNTQIAVLDFAMADNLDGLLGMNVLGQFRFQIDQENKNLILNRKQ